MRYPLLLICCLVFLNYSTHSQKNKIFTINPGEKITEAIPGNELYLYPEFSAGKVYFRDNRSVSSLLNYNFLLAEIQFTNSKHDTLSLADEKNINFIAIDKDTFYYDKGYIKLIQVTGEVKLAQKEFFELVNKEKIGGYGGKSSSSIDTYTSIISSSSVTNLVAQEVITLAKVNVFYIGDKFNHFKIADKKTLLDAYPEKQKEIKDFYKGRSISKITEADMIKLFDSLTDVQ